MAYEIFSSIRTLENYKTLVAHATSAQYSALVDDQAIEFYFVEHLEIVFPPR